MFTGIIEEVGRVDTLSRRGTSAVLGILASRVLESMQLGDSIAVNGVCLTVRHPDGVNCKVLWNDVAAGRVGREPQSGGCTPYSSST